MKHLLLIGHNDLRLFFRNRAWYVWLFLVPLAMTYFLGFAARGPSGPDVPRPTVSVENLDTQFLSRAFLEELEGQELKLVAASNRGSSQPDLRIPESFTERVLQGQPSQVELLSTEGTSPETAWLVRLRVFRALVEINSHLVERVLRDGAKAPLTAEALRSIHARENPVQLESSFAGRRPRPVGFRFSLPGNLVMYLMMNLLIFGAVTLARERQNGQLRRMAAHPVSRAAMIFGKIYGLMLLGSVQVVFFLGAGQFLFGVDLGRQLGAILITLLVYAWVAASLGVLVGSVVRAEDKVVGLCVLSSLVMAALGGCWWPLELLPHSLRVAAHCVPTGWAMDALHQLITFGTGLAGAAKPLAVLIGFGLAANLAAVKFFRA